MAVQPKFGRLLSILNNTRVAHTNPALYDYLKGLLDSNTQSQTGFNVDLKGLEDLIKNLDTDVSDIKNTSVLTADDESDIFDKSRQVLAGTGIAFDDTVDNVRIVNATGTVTAGPPRVVREIPVGALDGVNTTFTLAFLPIPNTEEVFLNGLLQDARGIDYSIAGAVITYLIPPVSTDRILVSYQRN